MTIKRAILIGTLLATTIALITIGVKTGSFDNKNKENYKPKLLSRNSTAIRVNAEEVMPTSLNWLINEDLSNANNLAQVQIQFKSGLYGTYWGRTGNNQRQNLTYNTTYTAIDFKANNNYPYFNYVHSTLIPVYMPSDNTWKNTEASRNTNNARVIRFLAQPTGNLLAWLNTNATPLYNNNVIISNETGLIREVTKQDTPLTLPQIIREDGLVKLYIDSGIATLNVNGTNYTNFNDAISISNDNIVITTTGTATGQSGYIFKILYTNSLTPVAPYPDPSAPMYDVIDLKLLMLNILTMPFTFISQAFNITLWPGTQYEFNISNFILSIIAIATILFIIRLFTSGFSVIGNYTGARNDKAFKKSQTRLNNAKAKNIENNTPRKSESHVTIKKEK